jgi:hypothetical protein
MSIFTKEFREDVYKFCKSMPSPFVSVILLIVWLVFLTPITLMALVGGANSCNKLVETFGFVSCEQSTIGWIAVRIFDTWHWIYLAIPVLAAIFMISKSIEIGLDREFDPEAAKKRRVRQRYFWDKEPVNTSQKKAIQKDEELK